jgi:cellulose synthase/poly-beta-1,6-N-acetylglucosamine synthase-like glycosyltransferase
MLASLIIPYYKDLVALELVLTALNNQSAKNRFEVVIAEDDNDPETKKFLDKHRASFQFEIQHVTQEDKGYRRSKALNNGIKVAKNELIIFIDGDCIPHKHFIKNYLAEAKENLLLYGRRVNLGEKISNQLRQSKKLFSLSFFSLLLSDSNRVTEGVYLPFYPNCLKSKRQPWGCNMGALKKNIIAINGFDEDYLEWGPEDLDFCHRLIQSGAANRSVKFQSIIYHLYHTSKGAVEVIKRGKKIFDEKVNSGIIFCKNGLTKI